MNTTENNKLIAEFLGFENASRFVGGGELMRKKLSFKYGCQQYEQYKFEDLKYHSDWNWLMEVVENIESENFKGEAKDCTSFLIKVVNTNCQIVDIFKDRFQINVYGNTKIEAVIMPV